MAIVNGPEMAGRWRLERSGSSRQASAARSWRAISAGRSMLSISSFSPRHGRHRGRIRQPESAGVWTDREKICTDYSLVNSNHFFGIHGWLAFGGPAMLTKMTEEDWGLVLGVSCLPLAAWGQGAGRPQVFRSLALFHGPQHYVASAAGRVRLLEQHLEALLALEPQRRVRNFLRSARRLERAGASRADVRLDRNKVCIALSGQFISSMHDSDADRNPLEVEGSTFAMTSGGDKSHFGPRSF